MMKKVFHIDDSEIIDGYLSLIGRTYEDFTKKDEIYLKEKITNDFQQVKIYKIFIYRREIDELYSGLTAKILIKWNDSWYKDFDKYLYVKNK